MTPWLRRITDNGPMWASWVLSRALGVVLLVTLHLSDKDLSVYAGWAAKAQDGALPYRDFDVEYPPGVLPFLALPSPSLAVYTALFIGCALAADALVLRLLRPMPEAGRRGALLWLVTPLALGPILWARFDVFVALVLVLAVRSLRSGRVAAAGGWLGAAALVKLWPAVIVLLLLPLLDARGRRRILASTAAAVAVPVAAVALVAGTSGLEWMLRYHAQRGLEIEALSALPIHLGRLLGHSAPVVFAHGSAEFSTGVAGLWLTATDLALLVGLGLLGVWVLRRRTALQPASVVLATVLVLLLTGKVLSPQYFVWLAAAVCLVAEDLPWRRDETLLCAVLCLLATQYVFPVFIGHLEDGKLLGVLSLGARDAVLLVLAAVLVLNHRALTSPANGGVSARMGA